jgi:hypothetical protein
LTPAATGWAVAARPALLVALLLLAPPAPASIVRYLGQAVDAGGVPVYVEEHFLQPSADGGESRLVLYRCPGGEPFARKRLRRDGGRFVPAFELEDLRAGYREGVAVDADGVRVFAGAAGDDDRPAAALAAQPDWVADAGFDAFIQARRAQLEQGRTVRFQFLVPAEGRTRTLTVRKVREGRVLDRPASLYRLELGAWYGFLAPHIDGWYDRDSGGLLRYQGISNIRGADGRSLQVRIDFPPGQRSESVDPQALARAASTALVDRCPAPP